MSTPDESHTLLAVFNRVGDLTLSVAAVSGTGA
jgi:hypothetical protein